MKESFALDEPQMLARGVDAFKTEMLANLLERGSDAFAPLVFLKEGIYLRLSLCKAIHHKMRILVTIYSMPEKVIHRRGERQNFLGTGQTGQTSLTVGQQKTSQSSDCEGFLKRMLSGSRLFSLLRLGRFFRPSGAVTTSTRTITAVLWTVATGSALAFISTFSRFGSFVSGSFGATAALFGPLFFSPGFRCRSHFGSRKGSAAFDADFEFGDDVRMEAKFDIVFAKGADRMFEMDLAFVEANVELGLELVGDHAGGDGAEHFAVLTGFDRDDADELGEAPGELGHGVEVVGFAFGAAFA